MNLKKNLPLLIAISIPILILVLLVISITLPSLLVKPQYDFIYMAGDNYDRQYYVENSKLTKSESKSTYLSPAKKQFFLYDIQANIARELTFDEAQTYTLNPNKKSPDGMEIISGGGSSGFLFFSSTSYGYDYYILGHGLSKKLNIPQTSNYDGYFNFLGWVMK